MTGGYRIVLANSNHLAKLRDIELAAAEIFREEDVPDSVRLTATSLSDLEAARARGTLWTALAPEGEPVGFAIVRMVDGSAFIQEIDVHPDHSRRGVGTSLISAVCEWARSEGLAAVTLTTFRHLPWNAPFYARLGFKSLPAKELTPGLAAVLAAEVRQGLDPVKRVAMRMRLS